MKPENLADWIEWIQLQHSQEIDLGLVRVAEVAERLGLEKPSCPVITVGGTNGKGSCVATLEAIYLAAGYRVGVFNSPILFKHNEYVRVQGLEVNDVDFCEAFVRIENARSTTPLTFFEFNTLAAIDMFTRQRLDIWLLEVGLGGRLDAVNIIDADVAIVTSVAIDHADRLGATRELIGKEKAGIFRVNKPAVCGDFNPPLSLQTAARKVNAPFFCQGKEFDFQAKSTKWSWWCQEVQYEQLPLPLLAMQNCSSALMAIDLLQTVLPVEQQALELGIKNATLTGRVQIEVGPIITIYDVAHNPSAAEFLSRELNINPTTGKTRAVFSMLADKDIVGTLEVMKTLVNEWHTAVLPVKRAASFSQLLESFKIAGVTQVFSNDSIESAYQKALHASVPGDRIVVFGSFHTVAKILLAQKSGKNTI